MARGICKRPPGRRRQRTPEETRLAFSKRLVSDIRSLLWVVTVGGLALAFYCIYAGYSGSLPWIGAMVGLPWTAHGTVCAFYLNLAKSDHREGGITYETAKAHGFLDKETPNWESPAI